MGKFKERLTAKIAGINSSSKPNRKKLALSIVSLFIATTILISATYCWYALANSVGTASNVNLTAGNGLRVNDLGDTFKEISDNSYLLPASSVDGRNLFFPADGTDFSSSTQNMTFRFA
ncbi:MAG: hypothetical protein J1E41_02405, partial [Ruminococcus sp.]|nr:hypothetical protein [Ruminococcus sp.]